MLNEIQRDISTGDGPEDVCSREGQLDKCCRSMTNYLIFLKQSIQQSRMIKRHSQHVFLGGTFIEFNTMEDDKVKEK